MRRAHISLLAPLVLVSAVIADAHAPAASSDGPTAKQAYRQLLEGHARYVNGVRTLPHQDEGRRCETTSGGQHPIAAVLSCADSRVPPEMLFDQGIGDLFVIRVAGNVAAADEIGTLEYGIEHLNIPLIVVLGHSKCGAVTAVVNDAHTEGNLAELLKPIVPAAERAKHDHPDYRGTPLVNAAIEQNVRQAMSDLTSRSPVLAKAVAAKRLEIAGGVYDIHSGRIDWLDGDSSIASAPAAVRAVPAPAHDSHADHGPMPAAHQPDPHAAPAHAPAAPAASHGHAAEAADDDHAPAAKPAADKAHAAATPVVKIAEKVPTETRVVAPASLTENWYLLIGMVLASTLIGAAVTRFVPQAKA